jgi:hypothetical protein
MMKTTHKFADAMVLSMVATFFFAAIVFADSVVYCANSDTQNQATKIDIAAVDRGDDPFAAIKMLHDKLGIIPLQENLWDNVVQVMMENAKTMEILVKSRSSYVKAMTAIDDLKSYYDIASAHAEGLKKFIPAFEALYVSMSDDQQKKANILFQNQRMKMMMNKASQ